MSWSISNIDNSVVLTKEQAFQLLKVPSYFNSIGDYCGTFEEVFPSETEISDALDEFFSVDGDDYYLVFIEDHMEHMDYLACHKDILDTLQHMGVTGDITFGSLDGDNAGSFWGYRFYGHFEPYRLLQGEVQFHAVDPSEV